MARKHAQPAHENHERWLISYADFITLLFALFVVMFATSQSDKSKAQQVSNSVKTALEKGGVRAVVHEIMGGTVDDTGKGNAMMKGSGGAVKAAPVKAEPPEATLAELTPSMQYLTQTLANEIKSGKIDIHLEARGLVVSLRQAAFFPSGGDEVAVTGMETLSRIAVTIAGLNNPVRLEGHTDSAPISNASFRSNWHLSAARSIAMLELITTRFKLSPSRFAVAGYADTIPVDTNSSPEGRAHNRRVDIVILNRQVAIAAGEPAPSSAKANE